MVWGNLIRVTCAACLLNLAVAQAQPAAPAQPETVSKTFNIGEAGAKRDLTFKFPKAWEERPASSNLRLGEYRIKPVEGDKDPADLAIFPPFGGTVQQNLDRQLQAFQAAERKAVFKKGESPLGAYVLADISGTYNKPVGPPIQQKTEPVTGQRMLYVVLSLKAGGNVFLKLTGPDKTVAQSAAALRASFDADAAKETDYKPEQ